MDRERAAHDMEKRALTRDVVAGVKVVSALRKYRAAADALLRKYGQGQMSSDPPQDIVGAIDEFEEACKDAEADLEE